MNDTTVEDYSFLPELAHVSTRELMRHRLTTELDRLVRGLADDDLAGETLGVDDARSRIDALKAALRTHEEQYRADFRCANRLCGNDVDKDLVSSRSGTLEVQQMFEFEGRDVVRQIHIGMRPLLALGFCGECFAHFDAQLRERAGR